MAALIESGCWQWCDDETTGWMRLEAAVATGGHIHVSWLPTSNAPIRGAVLGDDGSWTPATGIDVSQGVVIVRGGDVGIAVIDQTGDSHFRIDVADPFGENVHHVDLDPPVATGPYTNRFDASWRGDELVLVASQREQPDSASAALWIAAVGVDGTVRAAPRVLDGDVIVNPIGVATVGNTTWVAWTKLQPPGVDELEAARIGASASVLDTRALAQTVVRQLVSSGPTGLAIVDGDSGDQDAIVLDETAATMQHPFAGGTSTLSAFAGQGYLSDDGWYDRDGNRIADPPILPIHGSSLDDTAIAGGFLIHTVHDADRSTIYTAPLPFAGVVGADTLRDSVPALTISSHVCRYH
jgi:hypothetical protein